jgi:hypothetical protein
MLESDIFGHINMLIQCEGKRLCTVQNPAFGHEHFHLSSLHGRVYRAFRTRDYFAPDGKNELVPDIFSLSVGNRASVRIEYNLGNPFTVAQVYEDQAAVITTPHCPPHQYNFFSYVISGQRSAIAASLPVPKKIDHNNPPQS